MKQFMNALLMEKLTIDSNDWWPEHRVRDFIRPSQRILIVTSSGYHSMHISKRSNNLFIIYFTTMLFFSQVGYKDVGWVFTKNAVTYILNGKNNSVYCYEWSGQMGIVLQIMKTCFGKPIVLNIYTH